MDFALPEVKFEKGLVIHHLPAQAYEQIRKKEWNRMDKKQLIGTAINMLESVDPDTIEIVNFDRTEYDDGSVGFSVNLTTPATKPNKSLSLNGRRITEPKDLFCSEKTAEKDNSEEPWDGIIESS